MGVLILFELGWVVLFYQVNEPVRLCTVAVLANAEDRC